MEGRSRTGTAVKQNKWFLEVEKLIGTFSFLLKGHKMSTIKFALLYKYHVHDAGSMFSCWSFIDSFLKKCMVRFWVNML